MPASSTRFTAPTMLDSLSAADGSRLADRGTGGAKQRPVETPYWEPGISMLQCRTAVLGLRPKVRGDL